MVVPHDLGIKSRGAAFDSHFTHQTCLHQLLKTHIILGKEVDLHATGALHGTQSLPQNLRRHVDCPHPTLTSRFKLG